jgi:hypothetical protein
MPSSHIQKAEGNNAAKEAKYTAYTPNTSNSSTHVELFFFAQRNTTYLHLKFAFYNAFTE